MSQYLKFLFKTPFNDLIEVHMMQKSVKRPASLCLDFRHSVLVGWLVGWLEGEWSTFFSFYRRRQMPRKQVGQSGSKEAVVNLSNLDHKYCLFICWEHRYDFWGSSGKEKTLTTIELSVFRKNFKHLLDAFVSFQWKVITILTAWQLLDLPLYSVWYCRQMLKNQLHT